MGNTQTYMAVSAAVCSASLVYVYVYVYCSHKLLKTNVLSNDRLPSFVYLYIKYLSRAVTRRTGCLYTAAANSDVVYTVLNCR